jgi:hypothetical protein
MSAKRCGKVLMDTGLGGNSRQYEERGGGGEDER